MFSLLANAGTVWASLILVGSSFQCRIARGKNEFMWCFVFEWGIRNLLFHVVVIWLWLTLTCLLCILCSMNLRLFLALFVIVFMWDDQLRLLLRYFVFCGSEDGVMKCIWEDNRFLFSVYSKNITLVRVKFHWPFFFPKF